MNICLFYGQLFLEYSVELVFFALFELSSSPNLFIEPRKNLKGSWVRWCEMFAKNSQNFERYAFMVYVCQKRDMPISFFHYALIRSILYLNITS